MAFHSVHSVDLKLQVGFMLIGQNENRVANRALIRKEKKAFSLFLSYSCQHLWSHFEGGRVSREQLMMALADVEALMIRATYSTRMLQTM